MDDVIAGEGSAGLVCHGVNDAEQTRGECNTSDALSVVHVLACLFVALVGLGQPLDDLADGMQ